MGSSKWRIFFLCLLSVLCQLLFVCTVPTRRRRDAYLKILKLFGKGSQHFKKFSTEKFLKATFWKRRKKCYNFGTWQLRSLKAYLWVHRCRHTCRHIFFALCQKWRKVKQEWMSAHREKMSFFLCKLCSIIPVSESSGLLSFLPCFTCACTYAHARVKWYEK